MTGAFGYFQTSEGFVNTQNHYRVSMSTASSVWAVSAWAGSLLVGFEVDCGCDCWAIFAFSSSLISIRISLMMPLESHCLGFRQLCLCRGTPLPQKLSDVLSIIVFPTVQWTSTSFRALFWANFCRIPSIQRSLAHESHVDLSKLSISLDKDLHSRADVAFRIFLAVM